MSRAEPRIVGRYAIHGEIASGGMASVHFARLDGSPGPARTVAIKRAHPHLARDPDFALMFLDEARVASRIRHPNVVSTIDVLGGADDLSLVMDYVHGESLWKLMRGAAERSERVPLHVAASILIDTLHGLHAAHEATDEHGEPLRIVHRDVSPQNILVGVDGVTRLVDFGIAKAAGRLHSTHDSSVKGKYAYMAPEQVRGETVSRLTDTYAAAIVLWELVTGERLFVGKTEAETIHKCLVGRVQPPSLFVPELGPRVDEILKKALSREPARRYQTARDLAADIESCLAPAQPAEVGAWVERIAGDALAARAEVVAEIERSETALPQPEAPPSARPRRRWAMPAALLLTVLGVSVALLAVRRRGPDPPPPALDTSALAIPTTEPPAPEVPTPQPPVQETSAAAPVATTSSPPAPSLRPPPRHGPPRSSRPAHANKGACDPPYSIDAEGRQIFKPQCM